MFNKVSSISNDRLLERKVFAYLTELGLVGWGQKVFDFKEGPGLYSLNVTKSVTNFYMILNGFTFNLEQNRCACTIGGRLVGTIGSINTFIIRFDKNYDMELQEVIEHVRA